MAKTQRELTYPQELFLYEGKTWLNNEKKKEIDNATKN